MGEKPVRSKREHRKINKFYTLGEEVVNSISHGLGAILSAAGTGVLLLYSALYGGLWDVIGSAIFGATLIILYTSSTLYHSLQHPTVKKVFRIFDHCTIYLLIAGTYTPYTLITLREYDPKLGWTLFTVVWAAAILGIVLNSVDLDRFAKFSMVCYVAMGWVIIFAIKPLIAAMAAPGIWLLFFGGVMYTVGLIFYGLNSKIRYMHSIWHFFTLAGSVLHFLSILLYVVCQ